MMNEIERRIGTKGREKGDGSTCFSNNVGVCVQRCPTSTIIARNIPDILTKQEK